MKIRFIVFLMLSSVFLNAQSAYELDIVESTNLTNVPNVHSGAWTEWQGKWIFIGGRDNGLHGFQPPFAFPNNGKYDKVAVVDVPTNQKWEVSVSSLPTSIYESVTSSNMQFWREDSILYLIGGYGWNDSAQDFKTFPTITAVNLNKLIPQVMQGQPISSSFSQIIDSRMAVCGGHLEKLGNRMYLVFGHRFDGRYARHDSMGFFDQQYTNEIRKFELHEQAGTITISNYSAIYDSLNFHRRDYNLMAQYNVFGVKSLTAFSGVFRYDADLPYTSLIDIYDTIAYEKQNFEQQLSHYHSAVCAMYDSSWHLQHNIFFGGMSMYYYDSTGVFTTDSMVPFVNTLSVVVRDIDENYHELNFNKTLPALLGSNAYFIHAPNVPRYRESVISLNSLSENHLIGYIIGGIESPKPNINLEDPSMSFASPRVLEVWVDRTPDHVAEPLPSFLNGISSLKVFPNPTSGELTVSFFGLKNYKTDLSISDFSGKVIVKKEIEIQSGNNTNSVNVASLPSGNYLLAVGKKAVRWTKK